jgi:hypothetical protein
MTTNEDIEGGSVLDSAEVKFNEREFHDKTARAIAVILVIVFALSFFAELIVLTWVISYQEPERIKIVEGLFKTWLPVISGLTGSAVTYYFTSKLP